MKFYLFTFSVILYTLMGLITGTTQVQACPMKQIVQLEICEQTKSSSHFESVRVVPVSQYNNSIQYDFPNNCSATSHKLPCNHTNGNLCCFGGTFQPLVLTLSFGSSPRLIATRGSQYLDPPSASFSFHPEAPYRPPVFTS